MKCPILSLNTQVTVKIESDVFLPFAVVNASWEGFSQHQGPEGVGMHHIPLSLLPFTRKAFPGDVTALKDHLRQDDARDVLSICGHTLQALRLGWRGLPVTFFMPGKS